MAFNNNKNGKYYFLIYFMAKLTNSSRAQTTGPTVTSAASIVPGSTSIFSVPRATSVNLTSDFISGLIPVTATSITLSQQQPTEIVFITASSSNIPSTTVAIDGSTTSSLSGNNSDTNSTKLSSTDLGAIIGGCAGGLLLISAITAICCIRRKKKRAKKAYDLSRGISASMIFSKDAYKQPQGQVFGSDTKPTSNDNNNPAVKRYNVNNDKTLVEEEEGRIVTPPVILYSDMHNEHQQQKRVNNSTSPQPRQPRATSQISKGARLSKYNFLSQAFSQMRTSYGGGQAASQQQEEERYFQDQPAAHKPSSPSSGHKNITGEQQQQRSYHDSMVLSPYDAPTAVVGSQPYSAMSSQQKKYQMYSMYQNTDSSLNAGGGALTQQQHQLKQPQYSTSTFFNGGDPHRESTMTVGTLHAPLFQHQHSNNPTPPPSLLVNRNLYTSGVITPNMNHRDSILSSDDVSQYSSPLRQESSPNPATSSSNNTTNKPYRYF